MTRRRPPSAMPAIVAIATTLALAAPGIALAQLQVVSTTPALNGSVATSSTVSVEFDRPLDTATIDADSFRVFGRGSGAASGPFSFSNGDRTVTLTPAEPFSAGEFVFVNLSHDIKAADTSSLRAAGYAFQFMTTTAPSAGTFAEIDTFSNRTSPGTGTRIYGAAATDLNGDGYLDLATVNEDSADVRVFLNLADQSGLFGPMRPREPIGVESSPNEQADFDNDGKTDLCVAAAQSGVVNILLGEGDGDFASNQEIDVGSAPHGIVPLDVDGDGDLDVVNANVDSNNLSLMLNDGNGVFGAPTFFEGGVNGEYGLVQADMNGDGITDLVVAGRNGSEIATMLGNGNGTFTAAGPAQPTGGQTWVVVLGDVNGDGDLDAVTANDGNGNIGVLLGEGDGTFEDVTTINIGSHVPSVDLGDLDGDGDLDMVVSSFGGGFWRRFANDGTGTFSFVEQIPAPSNPSCSILFDSDNDGDLDMALTDEIADVVILMRNGDGAAASSCSPGPSECRTPIAGKKAKLQFVDKSPDTRDRLTFTWSRGAATVKADFDDPVTSDGYELCLYEDGLLVSSWRMPAAGTCGTFPCWKDVKKGFNYRDNRELTPDGIASLTLREGTSGRASIKVVGKSTRLDVPDLSQLGGVLDVQLQKTSGGVCWGATFSPPYRRNDGVVLTALSDAPDPIPDPVWSEIHALVIAPRCAGCHGSSGGLGPLADCNLAWDDLVGVASTRLPTMSRVEPGDAAMSWLVHKLDGTHDWFSGACTGGFCGSRMPLGGPYLPLATRDAIRAWIEGGASNDCP